MPAGEQCRNNTIPQGNRHQVRPAGAIHQGDGNRGGPGEGRRVRFICAEGAWPRFGLAAGLKTPKAERVSKQTDGRGEPWQRQIGPRPQSVLVARQWGARTARQLGNSGGVWYGWGWKACAGEPGLVCAGRQAARPTGEPTFRQNRAVCRITWGASAERIMALK